MKNIDPIESEYLWQTTTDKRSSEEIYESILSGIRKMYDGKLLEPEVHQAARNLIEFVKILLKHYEQSN